MFDYAWENFGKRSLSATFRFELEKFWVPGWRVAQESGSCYHTPPCPGVREAGCARIVPECQTKDP